MRNGALAFAGISGCMAVMLGALGAHALSGKVDSGLLTSKSMHAYETAVHYQMMHTLAILAMIALKDRYIAYYRTVITLFIVGIVLFSGSIYLLVAGDLTGINFKFFGPITPLGGLCFIAAWFMVFIGALKANKEA